MNAPMPGRIALRVPALYTLSPQARYSVSSPAPYSVSPNQSVINPLLTALRTVSIRLDAPSFPMIDAM